VINKPITFSVNVNRFEHHQEVKNKLLEFIENESSRHIRNEIDHISKSDYVFQSDDQQEKDYQALLEPLFHEHCAMAYHSIRRFSISKMWYQQYSKGDIHTWHVHGQCHWANVYFLELPDPDDRTEVMDLEGNLIEYDAKEGDIIFFPGCLLHRSKTLSDGRKTVISFNSDFSSITSHNPHYRN